MANGTRIKVGFFKNADKFLTFKSGEIIFREGDAGAEMFVVRSGRVDLKIGDKVLDTVGEEETFGEMALIDQRPRSASAVAATDCEIVPVDSKRFLFLVQQTPNFALLMLKIMANRLRNMDSYVSGKETIVTENAG